MPTAFTAPGLCPTGGFRAWESNGRLEAQTEVGKDNGPNRGGIRCRNTWVFPEANDC